MDTIETTIFQEPFGPPNGLGVRQSSAAVERRTTLQSGRGLPHSRTLARVPADGEFRAVAGEPGDCGASAAVWQLHEFAEVTSTNRIAAKLPAWHAVRADTQTAGRGRFQRSWVSDAGGLWLSAVVPVETNSPAWRMLPLAAGLAVCAALRECGVKQLRLRWPNDILVDDRKLAGLLIDQFQTGLAVVGIGINVSNHPEARDAALRGQVMRLADLISPLPSVKALAHHILVKLSDVWREALDEGPASILSRVNELWELPRRVQLDLDGTHIRGDFAGVDESGRLLLRHAGTTKFFESHAVRLLRDIQGEQHESIDSIDRTGSSLTHP